MAAAKSNQSPSETWLTAGFRSVRPNEFFIFMKKEGALYFSDYYSNGMPERLLRSPAPIVELFPSLRCTIFEDAGIDCAFTSNKRNKAYIFSYDQCAEFDYAPYDGSDGIVGHSMAIIEMFPCLKNTDFDRGIDAAFDARDKKRAYLIKGNKCACIGLDSSNPYLITQGLIRDMFPVLRNTTFENGGWDAAYAFDWDKWQATAAVYKGDSMLHLHFNTPSAQPQIKWGPEKIKSAQKNLGTILPRKNLIAN